MTGKVLDRTLQLAAILLAAYGILASAAPNEVRGGLVILAIFLVAPALLAYFFKAIPALKAKIIKKKISGALSYRLGMLLSDSEKYISCSHLSSPFSAWMDASNRTAGAMRFNHSAHHYLHSNLLCFKEALSKKRADEHDYQLLSVSIASVAGLAEEGRALIRTLQIGEVRKDISDKWNYSLTDFNRWLQDWDVLFKEMRAHFGCEYYKFSVVGQIS